MPQELLDLVREIKGETARYARWQEIQAFFLQGMLECEGSEQARYANIYSQLVSGENVCFDEK